MQAGIKLNSWKCVFAAMWCTAVVLYTGCRPHDIKLQVVHQTSDRLECDKVFNTDRKLIVELNEILVQTGRIDREGFGTNQAAIIHVDNQEIVLYLKTVTKNKMTVTELYAERDYKLILRYEPVAEYHTTDYKGEIEIWKGKQSSRLSVTGVRSNL